SDNPSQLVLGRRAGGAIVTWTDGDRHVEAHGFGTSQVQRACEIVHRRANVASDANLRPAGGRKCRQYGHHGNDNHQLDEREAPGSPDPVADCVWEMTGHANSVSLCNKRSRVPPTKANAAATSGRKYSWEFRGVPVQRLTSSTSARKSSMSSKLRYTLA